MADAVRVERASDREIDLSSHDSLPSTETPLPRKDSTTRSLYITQLEAEQAELQQQLMELYGQRQALVSIINETPAIERALEADTTAMAEGSKKRRAHRHKDDGERPRKRAAVGAEPSAQSESIEVSFAESAHGLPPVTVTFNAYAKPRTNADDQTTNHTPAAESILLHSPHHASLDYTASADPNRELCHYIGVFDPTASTLKIFPSHSTILRSALRSELAEVTRRNATGSYAQQREELGKAFGTKKAKKIIAGKSENAITAGSAKDVEAAVLDSVKPAADDLPARDDHDSSILASKPIPRPNLDAEAVKDVYPLDVLAPQGDLRFMNVKDWRDAVNADQEVKLPSRYVANRLRLVVSGGDVQKLKALKYLLLLLNFNDALVQMKGGKKLPQREQFKTKMSDWHETSIDSVRRRFAEGSDLNKWHVDNLLTHIAALTLYIDDWRTDTSDIREDLRLDLKQITQYFLELGCKVSPPTEKERLELKITNKAVAAQKRFAKLKLPLEFPKARLPPRRR